MRVGVPKRFLVCLMMTAAILGPSVGRADDRDEEDLPRLARLEADFKSVADRFAPAVVAISASQSADLSLSAGRSEAMNGEKLQRFLSKTTRLVGTGVIFDPDGYLLTNDHVIDGAQQLWVTTDDKKVYPAVVVGSDPRGDLAVLKIPGHHLPVAKLFTGNLISRGQWSIAMGNPFGMAGTGEMSLSVGVVAAVHRSLPKLSESENRSYGDLIQTTAQINPGNSGGPLFNLQGDVIGINTAVIMPQKGVNGIGFAIPVNAHLRAVVSQLKAGHEVVYGYLGTVVTTCTAEDRESLGLKANEGVRVDIIRFDSPAAGVLKVGDVVRSVDGQAVTDSDDFVGKIAGSPVSRPVGLTVLRQGSTTTMNVTLTKRDAAFAAVTADTQRLRWGGLLIGPLPATEKSPGLLVLDVDADGPLAARGVRPGMILRTVAGKTVADVTQLQSVINDTPTDKCALGTETMPVTATADLPRE